MTSVNFPAAIGGDNSTVSDDDNPSTGLAKGGHRTRFVPALAQLVGICVFMLARITDWSNKLGSTVDGVEWSAKEYAVGTTVPAGSAARWANLTGAAVSGSDYSAKEYAVGSFIRTSIGSARDWATFAGPGLPSSEFSAKEYAVGTAIRGTIGSAADWAKFTGGTVDGVNKSAKAYALDAQAFASSAVNAPGTSGTSTTSLTIGTGSKAFTTQTGKAWSIGQFVVIARTSAVNNYMVGQITAYDPATGAMTVNVTSINGSGTFTDWTIALTSSNSATVTGDSAATANTYALRDANGDVAFRYATVDRLLSASTTAYIFDSIVTTLNLGGAVTTANFLPAITTLNFASTATSTRAMNLFNGATVNGATLTVNLGTGGAAGSVTNFNIGSAAGGKLTVNSPNVDLGQGGSGSVTNLKSRDQNIGESGQGTTTLKSATTEIQGRAKIKTNTGAHVALGSVSGAVVLDLLAASSFSCTITGNTTFSLTNAPAAGEAWVVPIKITNGGTAVITYPSGSVYPGRVAQPLTVSGTDRLLISGENGAIAPTVKVTDRDIG